MNPCNVKPNTIFCRDNLLILPKLNGECVDLIYLDPPFNKKKQFTAPIGSSADGAGFKDYFTMSDVQERWLLELQEDNVRLHEFLKGIEKLSRNKYNYAYLVYMAMRLIECQRLLKPTGSVYLHCDHTMSHYLKLVMDIIFGEKNFRNEIIWYYGGTGNQKRSFPKKHDTILFYAKGRANFYAPVMVPAKKRSGWTGKDTKRADSVWRINTVFQSPERKTKTDYPTQKPLPLLTRIIAASSKPGDLVLDAFCGCATACVAAQMLQRKWIGIDVSEKAWTLVNARMKKEVPSELQDDQYNFRVDVPKLTRVHPNHSKYIYVIGSPSYPGKYKVGIASDVKRRLGSYKTGSPNRDYEIIYQQQTEYYAEIEQRVHKDFAAEYEWVTADQNAIVDKIKWYIQNPGKLDS